MQPPLSSQRHSADDYWRMCWLDTERQLAATTNSDLRTVYAELLAHYQRMADRYDSHQLSEHLDAAS